MSDRAFVITRDGERVPLVGMCHFPLPPGDRVVTEDCESVTRGRTTLNEKLIQIADAKVASGTTVYDASTDTCRPMIIDRTNFTYILVSHPGKNGHVGRAAEKLFSTPESAKAFRVKVTREAMERAFATGNRLSSRLHKLLHGKSSNANPAAEPRAARGA